jgi:hypothetical protein
MSEEKEEIVIHETEHYHVEIGLPVKIDTLGVVYKVVNKAYGVVEAEKHFEHEAVILADGLNKMKNHLKTDGYREKLQEKH